MTLSPEIRRRIVEEERIRLEARERVAEEIRLRRQNASLISKTVVLLMCFAIGMVASEYYFKPHGAIPEVAVPARKPLPAIHPRVLDEITEVLRPPTKADVCVVETGLTRVQIKGTIELARDTSGERARQLAVEKAGLVAATLKKHRLIMPAYVEVFSPTRWYGVAFYDSQTEQISWDPCPGRCADEGTQRIKRCRP